MRVFVSGATGNVGHHVVRLLADEGVAVRALTRRPGQVQVPEGVEVVGGDLDSLPGGAFDGVDALYLMATGDTAAVVRAAADAGVRRVVTLSSASVEIPGDANGAHHRAAEEAVEASGLAWTHLRPGMFAGNLRQWAPQVRAGVVREPLAQAKQAPVHELDIAEVAAAALTSGDHEGKSYLLSGPAALSKPDQLHAINTGAGTDARFEEITVEQWRAHAPVPAFVVDMLIKYWTAGVDTPDAVQPHPLGKAARPLDQWAADHASEFRG
ncbi:SDR family oxidoreductase [Actinokineospora bangkokensis]|uniref:NAD(P)-binding domain-containing protein n=1 Tax=Actinokineospora bangkokensis TaxID=1193682 RepID=A0A1Q9LSN0_9PSEU|nr:NAD(P)H-binding protein [Actinokineospora bangkokensis]OLR95046.1 hypothetical protein BJP25_08810 [Actinokineospora bangkokensis]